MSNHTKLFKELHYQDEPLLLGNVWNVPSATVFEKLNFKAIATSSAAVAETLGYSDGENMPFDEYYFIIKRIKESTTIPLSVDLEAGYGKTEEEVLTNITKLYKLGVAGINIEDSVVNPSGREIISTESFTKKLQEVIKTLRSNNIDIFINVRCDAFLLNLPNSRNEAVKRIMSYEKTGADGIFLPMMVIRDDIKATVEAVKIPVNVMCMPTLPNFDTLKTLGIKRISMGPFVRNIVYQKMAEISTTILKEKSFSCLFKSN